MRRRDFLGLGAAALAGLGGLACVRGDDAKPAAAALAAKGAARKRSLRVAHLTDIHLNGERDAERWTAKAFAAVQSMEDPPTLILNGGDCVMDAYSAPIERAREERKLWRDTIARECSLPIEHVVGNHDVWGWDRPKSGATGKEPHYGKAWSLEMLGLEKRYRFFDRAGWRFIVLDSVHPRVDVGYEGRLDEEQFAWLANALASTPPTTPVAVVSHIPILAACVFLDGENEKRGDWVVRASWMHIDARRLKDLFARHANVKTALSGHVHLLERVAYNGVTYLCDGAVCGNWWKGSYQETPPGYAIIDLFDDGSVEREYVQYGWSGPS
jgi:Icc protein